MDTEAGVPLLPHDPGFNLRGTFAASLAGMTAALLVLLELFAQYAPHAAKDSHVDRYYSFLTVSGSPGPPAPFSFRCRRTAPAPLPPPLPRLPCAALICAPSCSQFSSLASGHSLCRTSTS
jgi:hypothetical protein